MIAIFTIALQPVWPDVEAKISPNFPIFFPKCNHDSFYLNWHVFLNSPKRHHKNLGHFCDKFCHQKVSKIAKFDHTVHGSPEQKSLECRARRTRPRRMPRRFWPFWRCTRTWPSWGRRSRNTWWTERQELFLNVPPTKFSTHYQNKTWPGFKPEVYQTSVL